MNKGALRRGNGPAAFTSTVFNNVVHVHPAVAVAIFAPVALVGTVLSAGGTSVLAMVGWAAMGYVGWTLFEYWGHRLIFHYEPERGIGARLHWLIHGLHHEFPQDMRRSIMSPFVSVPTVAVTLLVSNGLLGVPLVFGSGFVVGYLTYDLFHLYLHHGQPTSRLLRRLREDHMRHHFRDDTKGFGISAPYWDRVFGTAGSRTTGAVR